MQSLELRVVALGRRLRSVALEHGFDLNEAGLIVHETVLYILRDSPDATRPIPELEDADQEVETTCDPAPSAWRGR
jgi:hypothetical protein